MISANKIQCLIIHQEELILFILQCVCEWRIVMNHSLHNKDPDEEFLTQSKQL